MDMSITDGTGTLDQIQWFVDAFEYWEKLFLQFLATGFRLNQIRLRWLFAKVVIISSEKPNRVVSEGLWVFRAPLRRFDYALGNHFPHRAGVGRPSELAARFFNSVPRIVESGCKYLNKLRIKGHFWLNELQDFNHRLPHYSSAGSVTE